MKSSSGVGDESNGEKYPEELARIIMKVSSLCASGYMDGRIEAERLSAELYAELFSYATKNNQIARLNNVLLVSLGLIKVLHTEKKNIN